MMKKIFLSILVTVIILAALFLGFVYFYIADYLPVSNTLDLDTISPECSIVSECGELIGVNCGAEVDGTFYYVNRSTEEIVSYCGGYCMDNPNCGQVCPPKEWSCK